MIIPVYTARPRGPQPEAEMKQSGRQRLSENGGRSRSRSGPRLLLWALVLVLLLLNVLSWRRGWQITEDNRVDPRHVLRSYTRARRQFTSTPASKRPQVPPGVLYGGPLLLAVELCEEPEAGYWPLLAIVTGADFLPGHRAQAALRLVQGYDRREPHLFRMLVSLSDQSRFDPRPVYRALLQEPALSGALRVAARYGLAEWLARHQPRSTSRDAEIRRLCREVIEDEAGAVVHPLFPPYTIRDMARLLLREVDLVRPGRPAPSIRGVDLAGKPMTLAEFRGKVVVLYFWGAW